MTNQKYYVRLKSMDTYLICDNPDKGGVIWIDEYKQSFTKSELAEIMGGALYRHDCRITSYMSNQLTHEKYNDGCAYCSEWINSLIELVPVEEEK